jgi:F-type H+-transporting ATPase subunit b
MMKAFLALLLIIVGSFGTAAFAQNGISPQEVESLPFNREGVAMPNTESLLDDLDSDNVLAEAIDDEKKGLPQFNIETFPSQIFWLAISFTILYVFFSRSALPKLSATIEDRITTVQSDFERADTLSQEAQTIKATYEASMAQAHEKARAAIARENEASRKNADKAFENYKARTAAETDKLLTMADKEKTRIKDDLSDIAIELTRDIIEKISPLTFTDEVIEPFVNNALDDKTSTVPLKKKAA